ncbi:substrate-binding domain-containing protein [Kineococcus sp. R8]|uniref:substrate-binding domain-containing protein n=1 Tax=Kineococcus siccus TaxID=2696567 RepID=UPI0014134E95|nr:substrate-binding domain-containing protein [Kineococcus siccus]
MPTITDVARLAGVSSSTVSYVLSGKRSISATTRARVEKAVADLGYRPHAGARALASSRTNVLGVVVPLRADVNVNVIMQFVHTIATTARQHDHDVLLLTQEEDAGLQRVTSGALVDALIVMDIEAEDPRVAVLRAIAAPSVLIGVPRDDRGLTCVDFDFEDAARAAVEHLAGLGHRVIGLLGSPPETLRRRAAYAERVRGSFEAAAAAAGVARAAQACEVGTEGVRAALAALRAEQPELTGLVVHNEAALPALLAELARAKLRVPADVSVVTIGASDASLHLPQPLDSLDMPAREVGRVAVEMVMARLDGPVAAETRLLAAPLVERGSTAPPRRPARGAAGAVTPSRRRSARPR